MTKITQEEIYDLMRERGLTIAKVIDAAIDANALIGVGLITLSEQIADYTRNNPQMRKNETLILNDKKEIYAIETPYPVKEQIGDFVLSQIASEGVEEIEENAGSIWIKTKTGKTYNVSIIECEEEEDENE